MSNTLTTTYELPNFIGRLFLKGQRQNTLLQLMGGVSGWMPTPSTEFAVGQEYQVPAHSSQPAVLEGAAPPDHAGVARTQLTNVTQIWQEQIEVTYTKQGATQQLGGLNLGVEANPVVSEQDFQTAIKLEKVARQLNWVCINGTYQKPVDNTTARRTRGLLSAITTNVYTPPATPTLTKDHLKTIMKTMVDNGAIVDGDNVVCLSNTWQLGVISTLYETQFNNGQNRFVGGVRIRTVLTAFGTINFVLDQDMPQGSLLFVNLNVIGLKAMPIPGKGVLFVEPLAKTKAADSFQLYGEIGLDHGPEWMHGEVNGLATA